MKNIAVFPYTKRDKSKIDPRLLPYLDGWKLVEQYKGKDIIIPPTWDSKFTVVKYFEVYKEANDVNPGEEENEIGLRIEGGWWPYDTEVIIEMRIAGYDVLDEVNKVSAEIYKAGGAPMKLYHDGKLITDFKERRWFWYIPKDKVVVQF